MTLVVLPIRGVLPPGVYQYAAALGGAEASVIQPHPGAVQRIEPGQWVEMKSQQYGRIVVRLDRIDAVMMP